MFGLSKGDGLESDEVGRVEVIVLKLIARAVNGIYSLIAIAVVSAFAIGTFVTTTNERLAHVQEAVLEIKVQFLKDYGVRISSLEGAVAAGVLPRADTELTEIRKRLNKLERR